MRILPSNLVEPPQLPSSHLLVSRFLLKVSICYVASTSWDSPSLSIVSSHLHYTLIGLFREKRVHWRVTLMDLCRCCFRSWRSSRSTSNWWPSTLCRVKRAQRTSTKRTWCSRHHLRPPLPPPPRRCPPPSSLNYLLLWTSTTWLG